LNLAKHPSVEHSAVQLKLVWSSAATKVVEAEVHDSVGAPRSTGTYVEPTVQPSVVGFSPLGSLSR
jgi:hypothetical protein